MNISTIVIPAAGFGTRFLPFTKAVPKELLPLLNKPALQEIVEEGVHSGVKNFCIIISEEKQAIKSYFSHNEKLEAALSKTGKSGLLDSINQLIDHCTFSYPVQREMKGLGHAILMAKDCVKEDYFGVMLPDDIIVGDTPCMQQLIEVAQREQATVISVMEVPQEEISAYGSIKIGATINEDIVEVVDIIEKPKPEEAFSNLAIIGRYVLPIAIFKAIETITPQASGEIQLTDAITHLAQNGHKVLAYKIKGKRFDIGRPSGWLAANAYLNQKI